MWNFSQIKRYTFKPTVTIGTAYAAGEAFGPLLTVPVPGNPAYLLRTQIAIAAPTNYTTAPAFGVYLFDRQLALAADKATFVFTPETLVHRIHEFGLSTTLASGRLYGAVAAVPFTTHVTPHSSARFFYVRLIVQGAFTVLTDSVVTVSFDVASA